MAKTIEYNNMSVSEVLVELDKQGIQGSEANTVVAGWILENLYRTKRTFHYKESFSNNVAACMPPDFVRRFVHQNWVDGEDLVQAGDANGKEGFNTRFHKIEGDLDELGHDIKTLAHCLADLRLSLSKLLEEIRTEINTIYGLLPNTGSGTIVDIIPSYPGHTYPGYGVPIDRGPKYIGTSKILGKDMMLWETEQGIIPLPLVADPMDGGYGKRTSIPGYLTQYMKDNQQFKRDFAQGIDVDVMNQKYGKVEIGPGVTVADALAIVPKGSKYANADALGNDVVERTALSIKFTDGVDAAVAHIGGFGAVDRGASIGIDSLRGIPSDARMALEASGVKTASDLAALDQAKLGQIMKAAGISATEGATSSWVSNAKMLGNLRSGRG